MASKAATLGDPRRPQEVKQYRKAAASDDPPSMLALMGLILGMGGMMLRAKLLAWVAIFVGMAAVTHLPTDATDYKQVMMSITFAGMGLFNTYMKPMPHRPQPPAAPAPAAQSAL